MIDVSKIKKVPVLEDIKKTLETFLHDPFIKQVYFEDPANTEDDYESCCEQATELLEQVNARITELTMITPQVTKRDLSKS